MILWSNISHHKRPKTNAGIFLEVVELYGVDSYPGQRRGQQNSRVHGLESRFQSLRGNISMRVLCLSSETAKQHRNQSTMDINGEGREVGGGGGLGL